MNKDGTWDYMKEANALKEDADSLKALSNEFAEQASQLDGVQRLDKQKPEPEGSTPNPPLALG